MLLEHKHCDTTTSIWSPRWFQVTNGRGAHTAGRPQTKDDSCPAGQGGAVFIKLLTMVCNWKLRNYFWNFPFYISDNWLHVTQISENRTACVWGGWEGGERTLLLYLFPITTSKSGKNGISKLPPQLADLKRWWWRGRAGRGCVSHENHLLSLKNTRVWHQTVNENFRGKLKHVYY